MKAHFYQNRFALLLSGLGWLLMVVLVWSLPVSFCGYLQNDSDTTFWYLLSESGGVYGTTGIAVLLCLLAAKPQQELKLKVKSFAAAFGFLVVTLGGIALLNEYGIKPLTHVPRPSHQFLLGKAELQASLIHEFYRKDVPARQDYLRNYLQQNPEKWADVSPQVLAHWVNEAGYSFPSGHSQNAFMLGSMLTMWLGLQLPRKRRPWLLLPLAWAVLVCLSRVALGVHSELDVSLGAGLGLVLAYLLSLSGVLQKVFKVATHPEDATL
ncbi:phosphatase PAP2 family protein [Rufibacter roseus]|uniref:Phosphatase PAP2 family protein n=1 Tax=Rufibacter roseus TaxID=1567108 RepID=A0ABW2DQI1_9BACT|nr:phosphatase PAP2 family protein [Rufibacter roseus]